MPGAKPQKRTNGLGLSATLVDADQKAKEKTATVLVKVSGVRLVDPADAKEQSKNGQGHLHYQVDNGLVIATTTTKLSFHGLSSGNVRLAIAILPRS